MQLTSVKGYIKGGKQEIEQEKIK